MINNITLGSDVEFFVGDIKAPKKISTAEGLIPGTKKSPAPFGVKGFATQLDNVLAEGNIPPSNNAYDFAANMITLRRHLDASLKSHGKCTVAIPAAKIPEEFLQTENAKTFGCDP
jgi:hypothetical protein